MGYIKSRHTCKECGKDIDYTNGLIHGYEHDAKVLWHYLIKHKKWKMSFKKTIRYIIAGMVGYPLLLICYVINALLYPFWWIRERIWRVIV